MTERSEGNVDLAGRVGDVTIKQDTGGRKIRKIGREKGNKCNW